MKYLIFLIGCFLLTGCHDNTNITALSKEYFKKENVIFNPQWMFWLYHVRNSFSYRK